MSVCERERERETERERAECTLMLWTEGGGQDCGAVEWDGVLFVGWLLNVPATG